MREDSFSLEFKPLSNVKSVKDYEDEIHRLKNENFDLKTRLTHSPNSQGTENLPQILYEHSQQLGKLERERQEAVQKAEHLNQVVDQLGQEKRLMENKYSQEMFIASERMALLEDENKRLVLRMEKLNRESGDSSRVKSQLGEAECMINNLKAMTGDLEKQKSQMAFEYNNQINEMKNSINQMQQEYKNNIQAKEFEISRLRRELESEVHRNKDNSIMINDLKNTLSNEINEKRKYCTEEEGLKNKYESLAKEHEEYKIKIQNESKSYMAGMEKFRNIIASKLRALMQEVSKVSERSEGLSRRVEVSAENKRFLSKIKIKYSSLNEMVNGFKTLFIDTHKKIEVLKKEIADTTFFAENNKKAAVGQVSLRLEDFKSQLVLAKNELMLCRQYLEKKASETKNLKNENARLAAELSRKSKQIETAKVAYNGMVNNMNQGLRF